jgi:hypothetical protein
MDDERDPIGVNDDLKPMTLDQLIKSLQDIRAEVGGEVPVVMCDFEPVVRAGVVHHPGPIQERVRRALTGEEDCPEQPYVIITDRYEEADPI